MYAVGSLWGASTSRSYREGFGASLGGSRRREGFFWLHGHYGKMPRTLKSESRDPFTSIGVPERY
jgi:hypothetical protein